MEKEINWKEIGNLTKSIRRDLMELNKLAGEAKLTKKQSSVIRLAINKIDKFKSIGEGIMLSRNVGDFSVFYGDDE